MVSRFWVQTGQKIAIALVISLLFLTSLFTATALAQIGPQGTFTATRTCAATQSIRRQQNPGNIRVSTGQRFQSLGFNSSEKAFISIKVTKASPQNRWVKANCGNFSKTPFNPSPQPTPSPSPPITGLLPFFDTENNLEKPKFPGTLVDPTPPPPTLSDFDQAVLKTCGEIGTQVSRQSFQQLIQDNPEVFNEIKNAVEGELFANRDTDEEFLDDLTDIWFGREGFEHILCGEIDGPNKIGGLHFGGRYLQLQQQGRGGRLANNSENEEIVSGVIHTLGVVIVDEEGNTIAKDKKKGYGFLSSAEEILVDGTKAFKQQGNREGACIYPIRDEETATTFKAVFVKGQGAGNARDAIVTFFPDATPNGEACQS